MIYWRISALFLFLPLWAAAQQNELPAKVTWGDELKEPSGSYIHKVVSAGTSGFYAIRRKGNDANPGGEVFFEYYDIDGKLKRTESYELKYSGKKLDYEDFILLNGQLYLLVSFNNQAKSKNYLFYQKINNRLQSSGDLVKIGEVDAINRYREGAFDVSISRDSSHMLVYTQLPSKKDEPERFSLQVFDNQFKELWNKSVALPYGDDNFAVEEYRIDDNGNVYLLGVIYQDRSRMRRQGKPTYQYTIIAYSQQGQDVQEVRVDLKDKFITDLTFRPQRDGNLVCAGFFSEKNNYSIKGTYYLRMNALTKEVLQSTTKTFDLDFLTEYMTQGASERAREAEERGDKDRAPELYRYNLDELILRSDGGAVLVAEQYFVRERMYRYWDGTIRYDYYYYYNDIIVVNVRPDGEIEWTTRIPKRQETMNDEGMYSSYAMATVRDRFYFIYNDNMRNITSEGDRGNRYNLNSRNAVVAITEVRKDGAQTTFPLFANNDADIITRPKVCRQTGSRRMLVYGERGRNFRFARLEFQ
ncbi:MAG: hypothetical protein JNK77_05335 [Saprospiraceae bacterium]|nr:hypothetical protein [Saprospiraceae bacterium]